MWRQGQQQAEIQLSVPDSASLLPPFPLWSLPLPFNTRSGPLSLYLALKVGKWDITPLLFLPLKKDPRSQLWRLPLAVPDSCALQTTRSKTFPFLWQLKSVPQPLSCSSSNSLLAPNLCLLPSLSSEPHTPTLLSHILAQSWTISFSFIRLSISSTFFLLYTSSLRQLHYSPDIFRKLTSEYSF